MALAHARLTPHTHGFAWSWDHRSDELTTPLWLVTQSAVDLLMTGEPHRVRECPPCGWLYYDTSKNATRRWCSMEGCGSKVKARRQYERQKARQRAESPL
jgi:predicted RNA-binding Zn ribbon-like protein